MNRVFAAAMIVPSILLSACCCDQCRDDRDAAAQRHQTSHAAAPASGQMTPVSTPASGPALAGPKATPAAAGPRVVNAMCVINVEHPVQGGVENARYTADYKNGQKVGFCCEDCMDAWAAMSPAEKDKAVAEAIAAGRKM